MNLKNCSVEKSSQFQVMLKDTEGIVLSFDNSTLDAIDLRHQTPNTLMLPVLAPNIPTFLSMLTFQESCEENSEITFLQTQSIFPLIGCL